MIHRFSSKDIAVFGIILTIVLLVVSLFNLRASLDNVRLNEQRNHILRENQEILKRN